MESTQYNKKGSLVVLLVIDGWGVSSKDNKGDIFNIDTPYIKSLISKYPVALLRVNGNSLSKNYYDLGGEGNFVDSISQSNLSQIKISLPEKYAYLNFAFNGNNQNRCDNEERILLKSSSRVFSDVSNISSQVVKTVKDAKHNIIIASFSGLDLRLNSPKLRNNIKQIDKNIKKISKIVLRKGGSLFITSCQSGFKDKIKVVPLIIIKKEWEGRTIDTGEIPGGDLSLMKLTGTLKNISPTILSSIKIESSLKEKPLIK